MRPKRADLLAAGVCLAAGILICALPHFIGWARMGRPYYVASIDDRLYLAIASQAYFHHPFWVADPVFPTPAISMYRSLQFLPGIWGSRFFGLDPLEIGLALRVFGGASVGLGWYALFRLKLRSPWIAASLALMLLGDSGLTHGVPLIRLAMDAYQIAWKSNEIYFRGGHWIFLGWRSVTPATTMIYLMAFIWSVLRAREAPSWGWIVLAGSSFGLLFYVYFYYWTAAALGLVFALLLDVGFRRVYFHIGWIGGLIGLPTVVADYLARQRLPSVIDWLHRCDRFVTIGRFEDMNFQKDMLVFPIVFLIWVLVRQRDMIFVWTLGMAGILLEKHQAITRLQVENFHWAYVWGPTFAYLIATGCAQEIGQRLGWSSRVVIGFGVVGLAAFGVGLGVRAVEATGSDTIATARTITAYRAQFPAGRQPGFTPNSVVAGDYNFVDFAAIFDDLRPLAGWTAHHSALLTDAELDEREALNDMLQGVDRETFVAKQPHELVKYPIGQWYHDRSLVPGRVADRIGAYDHVSADLPAALDRFAVRYVGVPAGKKLDYAEHGWTLAAHGPTWDVWERVSTSRP